MIKPLTHLSALVFFVLSGCGGRVHESVAADPLAKFAGTWSGTYAIPGQAAAGAVTLTIPPQLSNGALGMTGTVTAVAQGAGTLDGYLEDSLDDGPYAIFHFDFASAPPAGVGYDHHHQGSASIDARGHLIIVQNLTINDGTEYTPENFDLARVTATP